MDDPVIELTEDDFLDLEEEGFMSAEDALELFERSYFHQQEEAGQEWSTF